jgi:hypothetical protein
MLGIERNTEETENIKKEGRREEDMTQKGSRKMCTHMSDHRRKEAQRIMINEMKGGIKRRKKVDRAKIDIKYIESEQRQNVRVHIKDPCFI